MGRRHESWNMKRCCKGIFVILKFCVLILDWLVIKCSFDRSSNKVGELILAVRLDDFSWLIRGF